VVLTKVDELGMGNPVREWRARSACEQREVEYRSLCPQALGCCPLCAIQVEAVEELIIDVVDTVVRRHLHKEHGFASVVPTASTSSVAGARGRRPEPRVVEHTGADSVREWVC